MEIPEKRSHIPKIKGKVSMVKAWLNRMKSAKITVRIPSAKNQPEPCI